MALLTLTVNNPSVPFISRSSEAAFLEQALLVAAVELRRGTGSVTSGPILTTIPNAPVGTASIGSWVYTPQAANP
jgi:hypothetical protein